MQLYIYECDVTNVTEIREGRSVMLLDLTRPREHPSEPGLPLALSRSGTHALSFACFSTLSLPPSSLSVFFSLSLSLSPSLSLSLSHTHTYTHTHTRACALSLFRALSLPRFLFLSLSLPLALSFSPSTRD